MTTGIDGGIRNCFDLFVKPQSKVIYLEPTFAMVDIYCKLYKANRIKISYDHCLELDYEKILNELNNDVDFLIIANPNSPTGTIIPKNKIIKILEKSKYKSTPVLIDEAYFGFTDVTTIDLIDKYPNLIVGRTFSKALGMAGCRIGYLVSNAKIIDYLLKFRPMYEVNSFGVMTAQIILDNIQLFNNYCKDVKLAKDKIIKASEKTGIDVIKTSTNFLHFDFKDEKQKIIDQCIQNDILLGGGI